MAEDSPSDAPEQLAVRETQPPDPPNPVIYAKLLRKEYQQLKREARARGLPVSQCVRDMLTEYFALRREMAEAFTSPGNVGDPHTGIILSVAARSEQRVARYLDDRMAAALDEINVVRRMVIRLAEMFLVHTPEVPAHLHARAIASATRRYEEFRQAAEEEDRIARPDGT